MDPGDRAFYFDNAVIPVPDSLTQKTRFIRLFLDSRYRDYNRYPSSSQYTIVLDDPIEKVISAKLINYSIPATTNMISLSNNMLQFSEEPVRFATDGTVLAFDVVRTVTVPSGNYLPADLATQLQLLINAVSRSTVTVTYDAVSQRFTFRGDLTDKTTHARDLGFSLVFTLPNTCARILGYLDGTVYYGALGQPVTLYYNNNLVTVGGFENLAVGEVVVFADATYSFSDTIAYISAANMRVQLGAVAPQNIFNGSLNHGIVRAPTKFMPLTTTQDDYTLLQLTPFGAGILPQSQPVGRAFAVLHKNFQSTQIVAPYERTFRPPMNSVRQLMVTFTNYDGQLCDFQGGDNFLEILLMVEKHPTMA